MKRLLPALTMALFSPLALAQTSQSQTDRGANPPAPEPSSSMRNPSTEGTGNYSNGSDDDKLQMKACLAKQRQVNPNSTEAEMKRNCAKLKPKSD